MNPRQFFKRIKVFIKEETMPLTYVFLWFMVYNVIVFALYSCMIGLCTLALLPYILAISVLSATVLTILAYIFMYIGYESSFLERVIEEE
ncbi:MAG: hypothetical protein DRO40_06735 [Thermoprotei archaeon]|nr:MAG: hypothetical protein DRO40_06735 [Thermoprotei archaeon]